METSIFFSFIPYYIHSTVGVHTAFTIRNYCHVLTMRRRRRRSSTHSPFSTPSISLHTHFPLADFNLMANSTIEHLSSVYTLFGCCCCCCRLFFSLLHRIFSLLAFAFAWLRSVESVYMGFALEFAQWIGVVFWLVWHEGILKYRKRNFLVFDLYLFYRN